MTDVQRRLDYLELGSGRLDGYAEELLRGRLGEPTVVTLCGSTRFVDAFNAARVSETLAGHIVLSIELVTTQAREQDPQHVDPELKAMLDRLHLRKIDLSHEILVLDVGGYIGPSTAAEIVYAAATGRRVRYLSEEGS